MRINKVLQGLLASAVAVSACTFGSPAEPSPTTSASLSGRWVGDVADSYGGAGRLRMSLDQVSFGLSGTFQFEFADPSRNRSGSVSGNLDQPPLMQRMQLASSTGFDCAAEQPADSFLQVTWTRDGITLKGTYAGFSCMGGVTGSFELTRD